MLNCFACLLYFFALLVLGSRRSGGSSLGLRAGSLLDRSMQND